ncbi:hypothetical protein [uncultured Erythrobacter sp.]|uniref:hypothetical protein n=1 Tax=uncultured Erythrobacter sp. TaxID=263913 RepID=UPI002611917B|nr:hypothetical protein [uncultured Erythrobacter sp.]
MNTLTKHLAVLPAAALAFAIPFAAPALAGEKSDGIVVTSQAAMEEWQAATTARINRSLKNAPIPNNSRPNDAVVQVTFTLGADGKAEDIEVLRGNGNWAARKSATYAVRRLNDLDTVPVNNADGAQFLANIFFASSMEVHKQLKADLNKTLGAQLAAADGDSEYILLGG